MDNTLPRWNRIMMKIQLLML